MSWINGIRGLVSSDELAKDVTGAEALLERHQVGPDGLVALPVPVLGTRACHWCGHLQRVTSSLLSSWQEHRTEIDARAGTFQAFEQFGQQLLAHGHYASPEIKEKLDILDQERTDLEKAWVQRRMMLDHCLELQVCTLVLISYFLQVAKPSFTPTYPLCSCSIGTVSKQKTGWLPGRPS